MIHENINSSFKEPPFQDGDVVSSGNYSQLVPGTEICHKVKELTITGGNFTNCKPRPTWDIQGGNWSQVSFCSHLHPKLVERGLPQCADDCEHRSKEKIELKLSSDEVLRRKVSKQLLPEYTSTQVKDKNDIDVIVHTVIEHVYSDRREA